MDRQAVYNTVRDHLMKQGRRALNGITCAYRGEAGRTCAVGCLIPDALYDPTMEGHGAVSVLDRSPELVAHLGIAAVHEAPGPSAASFGVPGPPTQDVELLRDLQSVHDQMPVPEWPTRLAVVAQKWGLEP